MAKKKSFKHLRMLASQLPVQWQDGYLHIKGEEILKRNKDAKDKDGNPIKADQMYKGPTMFRVDNYRRIKRLFKKKGIDGVNHYVDDIIAQHQESVKSHVNVLNALPTQPMSI